MKEKKPDDLCLEVQDLFKSYAGRPVVNGLSFNIKQGEIVGLLGPNGAGKTTAFYMTVGLIRPDKGQVLFSGLDVTSSAMHIRARMGMGYLAQEPSVFRYLSVEDNIMCILECLPISKVERKERLERLLQELHLERLAKKRRSPFQEENGAVWRLHVLLLPIPRCLCWMNLLQTSTQFRYKRLNK